MYVRPGALASIGLLILRLGAGGLLFFGHGLPKLLQYQERSARFADPIGLGPAAGFALVAFAEGVCSVLVMLGLLTRVSTIPCITFFLIAAFIQHAGDPWPRRELPLLFMVPFLALLFTGPGRYSLDALLFRRDKGKA